MTMRQNAQIIANARTVDVPIEKIQLDLGNVRFKHLPKKPTSTQIEKIIKDESDTYELCDQILAAKGVYEPLVITSDHIVIEGNRRLVCLRMLKEQAVSGQLEGISTKMFETVKCRILPTNTDAKIIDLFLASIHVKGKKPWKLFNRAKHIYRLNVVHGVSYDDLASNLGMAKVTIQRNVKVYKLMLDYSRRFPNDKEWFHKFTYFDELFKRKDLKEYRDDKDLLYKFASWVHDEKFRDVRDVRQLKKVFEDDSAYKTFLKDNFKEALKELEIKDPSLSNQQFKKIKDTIEVLKAIPRTELEEIKTNPAKMKLVIALNAETRSLLAELDSLGTSKGKGGKT